MERTIDRQPRNVHVSFTAEEISQVEKKANSAGMKVPSYVRQMALTGKVKGYDLTPFQGHTEAIGEVAAAVRDMIALPHPDRWAYEADIERIEDLLVRLVESEQDLIAAMTRRLKR